MKKISLLCAVAIAGLSLSACGHNSSKNKNTTSKQTSSKVVKKHHNNKYKLTDQQLNINLS